MLNKIAHALPIALVLTPVLYFTPALIFAKAASAQMNPDEMVRVHNQWRQKVGSPPLTWSNQLASVAQNWANRLASEGFMYHSDNAYGENLFSISGRTASVQEVVNAWGNEVQYFQSGVFPNVSKTGNWADVGHYTQVVWSGTTQVGCGVAGSSKFQIWVCNYNPPGNITGRSPLSQSQPGQTPSSPATPTPIPVTPPPATPTSSVNSGFFWDRQLTGAAFPIGTENNQTLYGCRVAYQGGVHLGKLISNQCNFGFGGQEIRSSSYEVLSFQGQTNDYRWVRSLSSNEQPVIGGKEANGASQSVCRATYRGGIHPGKVIGDRCNIGYGGQEIQLDTYEILVTQSRNAQGHPNGNTGFYWTNQVTNQSFSVGSERNQTLYSCRVSYQGGVHPGKLIGNQCNFGFGGKEIQSSSYQVLNFKGTTRYSWVMGNSSNISQSFIGGQESSGAPLAICRAAYQGGTHPGKVVDNYCNIGYGGQEVRLSNYEVLRIN